MSTRRKIFSLVAMALAAGLTLAVCEAAVRVFSIGPKIFAIRGYVRLSADPLLVFELVPGTRWEDVASPIRDDATISSAGLRDREYPEAKPENTVRIAIVGDSVAFGWGVRQVDTLAKALERLLAATRPGGSTQYEVLNFGVSGFNSQQVTRRVETAVARFHPDLVVYVYCLNDPEDLDDEIRGPLEALEAAQRQSFESQVRHARSIFSGLRLYQLFMSTWDGLTGARDGGLRLASYGNTPDYYSRLHTDPHRWNRVTADFNRMGSAVRRLNARFIAVIVPFLWNRDSDERFRVEPPLSLVHAQVGQALGVAGAHTLDLAPAIARYSRATGGFVGVDEVHFNESGNRLAAVALLDYLLKEARLPGATAKGVQDLAIPDPEQQRMAQSVR